MSPGCNSARLSAWLNCEATRAQPARGDRTLGPEPHRRLVAGQRHHRVNRPRGFDVERKSRAPDPLRRLDIVASGIARNLELRDGGRQKGSQTESRNSSAAQPGRASALRYRHGPGAKQPATVFGARSPRRYRRADAARFRSPVRPMTAAATRRVAPSAARRERAATVCWCAR